MGLLSELNEAKFVVVCNTAIILSFIVSVLILKLRKKDLSDIGNYNWDKFQLKGYSSNKYRKDEKDRNKNIKNKEENVKKNLKTTY